MAAVLTALCVFQIAPAATAADQTVTTAPLRFGTETNVTLPLGGTERYTFTGILGRRLGVQLTQLALSMSIEGTPRLQIVVYRPDGSTFYYASQGLSDQPDFQLGLAAPGYVETPGFDVPGTWTLELSQNPQASGTAAFTARIPVDKKGAIAVGTRFRTGISTPGQQVRYSFTGTAGLHPTLAATAGSWTTSDGKPGGAGYSMLRPDGTTYGTFNVSLQRTGYSWGELAVENTKLDASGTWTLVIDPYSDATGSQSFILRQVPDVKGKLTLGKRKTVTISKRGADAMYTFSWNGKGALKWAMDLGLNGPQLLLTSPDGVRQGVTVQEGSTAGRFKGNGSSGTWTLWVDPDGATVGTGHVTLSRA